MLQLSGAKMGMLVTGFPSATFVRNRDILNKSVRLTSLSCTVSTAKRKPTTLTSFAQCSKEETRRTKLRKVIVNLVTKKRPRPALLKKQKKNSKP